MSARIDVTFGPAPAEYSAKNTHAGAGLPDQPENHSGRNPMVSVHHEPHTAPDAETVIERHWPYDGPHSPQTLTSALHALDALTRYACNASRRGSDVGLAPELYRLLVGLQDAAERLPQLLDQLAHRTRVLGGQDDIRHDRHRAAPHADSRAAADVSAEDSAEYLAAACRDARALADRLGHARQPLSHLYHDERGEH